MTNPLNSDSKKQVSAVLLSIISFTLFTGGVAWAEPEGAPATAQALSASLPTNGAVTSGENLAERVSLDLRDMDIVDVLKFLSLKGKFNIAISKTIKGRVTIVLKDVAVQDALDIVLRSNNLAYNRVNNIVYVMTGEEYLSSYGKKYSDTTEVQIFKLQYAKPSYALAALDSIKSNVGKIVIDEDTGSVVLIDTTENIAKMIDVLKRVDVGIETRTYKLQYALAKDIAAQLKLRLDSKAVGSIQADDRSNQLIISAFPDRLNEIEKLIRKLDEPTKAVLIEVRILQLTLNPKMDYGINWNNPLGNEHNKYVRSFDISQSFPISSAVSSVGSLGSLTYGRFDADLLQVKLQALKQVINSRTLARPRLMVTNNEEANIHIGDTIPYVTSTTTGTGDTATVSEQINFIDVGIKLKVTPTINDDGMVTMKIRPEISSRTKDVETPKKALIPQVNTTYVETSAIVEDGNTVIIGGLKQLVNKSSKNGMPYLMDVPVAGNLFKSTSKDVQDTEIVIFLTPHIVTGSQNDLGFDTNDIRSDATYDASDAVVMNDPKQPNTKKTAPVAVSTEVSVPSSNIVPARSMKNLQSNINKKS